MALVYSNSNRVPLWLVHHARKKKKKKKTRKRGTFFMFRHDTRVSHLGYGIKNMKNQKKG